MSLKLVSLNVEQDKHLDTVRHFVEQEKADVVAIMEVCEDNLISLLPTYEHRFFMPNFHLNGRTVGVAIASHTPFVKQSYFYADGITTLDIPPHGMGTHRPLSLFADVVHDRETYTLSATHFTWTPDMTETDKQHTDLGRLIEHLKGRELVMCGDYNIPRGNGAYKKLATLYWDNIPPEVTTTIDPHLHRANSDAPGKLSVVVDYMWTTPQYAVKDMRIVSSVSDHCGVVAEIDIV